MTSWHKWIERKPTEADARAGLIEFAWHVRHRSYHTWNCVFQAHDPPRYWRTPTPLPGEESPVNYDDPMLNALLRAGRYIDVLAAWERGHGTLAAILEDEMLPLCVELNRVAVLDSPREVRSAIAGILDVNRGGKESGPAVAVSPPSAPQQAVAGASGEAAAAGSDAVRVLEALHDAAREREMTFRAEVGSIASVTILALEAVQIAARAALAAVKAQESDR